MGEALELLPEERENLVVFAGNTHPELYADIAAGMDRVLAPRELSRHPDGSIYARLDLSIRHKGVILIQTIGATDDENISTSFDELTELVNAAYESGDDQTKITALVPYLPSRQERQAKPGEAVSLMKNLHILRTLGVTGLVTVDPHVDIKNRFKNLGGHADQLTAQHLVRRVLAERMTGDREGYVVVSPDKGRTPVADKHAVELGYLDVKSMDKVRDPQDRTRIIREGRVDGVEGLTCFIFDDMIDTAGTLTSAVEALRNSGAVAVYAGATHGIFSDPGLERLQESPIDGIVVTDTLPMDDAKEALGDRLQVVPVGGMIGEYMIKIIRGESISGTEAGDTYF